MTKLIQNLGATELENCFLSNLNGYYKHIIRKDNRSYYDKNEIYSVAYSGIPVPSLNAIIQKQVLSVDKFENEIIPQINRLKLPLNLWLSSNIDKKKIEQTLQKNKFRYIGDSNGLAIEIDKMQKHDSPNSLFVQQIRNFEELEKWLEIASVHFNLRQNAKEDYLNYFKDVDFTSKNLYWRKYLGWLNAEPVACSTMILESGIAGIYDDVIIPRFKRSRWGIEESMISVPLKEAFKDNYKVGVVHSGVGDLRRYRGIGFSEVFKFPKYLWIAS